MACALSIHLQNLQHPLHTHIHTPKGAHLPCPWQTYPAPLPQDVASIAPLCTFCHAFSLVGALLMLLPLTSSQRFCHPHTVPPRLSLPITAPDFPQGGNRVSGSPGCRHHSLELVTAFHCLPHSMVVEHEGGERQQAQTGGVPHVKDEDAKAQWVSVLA